MATKSLIVGGTGGIGHAVATLIARSNPKSHVIISGRNKPSIPLLANMHFRPLDASSMRAIKQYTDEYKSTVGSEPHLDLLVLSQGILTMAGRNETAEGIDNKMALHYYGRQLLIRELMPVLKDNARVVTVLDSLRGDPNKLVWDDLDLKTNFSLGNAANHCMAMNDAMVQLYAAEQTTTKRHFVHAYPGVVSTDISGGLPWYLRPIAKAGASIAGHTPQAYAELLVKGTETSTVAGEREGRFWSYTDSKGNPVLDRPVWKRDQMDKVATHTWSLVDKAIASGAV